MFCRNCGKELCDDAFVCPSCGCLAKDLPKTQGVAVKTASSTKETDTSLENRKGGKAKTATFILCIVALGLDFFAGVAWYLGGFFWILLGLQVLVSIAGFILGMIQKQEKLLRLASILIFIYAISTFVKWICFDAVVEDLYGYLF